jgi:hypothetical protein
LLKVPSPTKFMGEVIQSTGQEFWRSPTVLDPPVEAAGPEQVEFIPAAYLSEACAECGSEYMIGAKFCHTCGLRRPEAPDDNSDASPLTKRLARNMAWVRSRADWVAASSRKVSFPAWLRYLHFHEIQRGVGLPTAALVAFIIGLGCVVGAISVSLFYKASNLAEFQAIQMWRIEWLLAATASFVAGILLKKPSDIDLD